MAKKRSCRRTTEENVVHEKAVKLRKMTDKQLVEHIEEQVARARTEGFELGKAETPKAEPVDLMGILQEIGDIRGIGATKIVEIGAVLEAHLEVKEDA